MGRRTCAKDSAAWRSRRIAGKRDRVGCVPFARACVPSARACVVPGRGCVPFGRVGIANRIRSRLPALCRRPAAPAPPQAVPLARGSRPWSAVRIADCFAEDGGWPASPAGSVPFARASRFGWPHHGIQCVPNARVWESSRAGTVPFARASWPYGENPRPRVSVPFARVSPSRRAIRSDPPQRTPAGRRHPMARGRSAGIRDTAAGISYTSAAKRDTGLQMDSALPVATIRCQPLSCRLARRDEP